MAGKHSNDYGEEYRLNKAEQYNLKQKEEQNSKQSGGRRVKEEQGKQTGKKTNVEQNKQSSGSGTTNLIFKIITLIYILITIIFCLSVIRMDLLPSLYINIFIGIEAILTFIIAIGLGKKHKTYKLNVLCLIIALLISSAYIYITTYTNATTKFIESAFTEVEETEDFYIVVRKESNYNKIEDISNKNIYLFQVEEDVKEEVGSKVKITLRASDSLTDMGNNLLKNKIEVILLSSNQYNMLSEEIENFADNTKIIYTASHEIEKTVSVQSTDSKYKIEDDVFNVYISGIDTSGRINNVSRSDANIVATVNTKTHEVLLTSIPRDYYVTLHSKGKKDKLTHSGIYGINETVATVEDLLDIDINYYVRVNFTTVIKLVDTLGGVNVYSDYTFKSPFGYSYHKGYNYLNGEQALAFSRERHSFSEGDNQRVKNQQHVIEAIIKKALSSAILTKYSSILESLSGSFQTNITQKDISSLVKEQLQNVASWNIKNNSLTGTDASRTTYSMGNQKLYVMIPNETSIQNAKGQIKNIMGK